MFYNREAAYYLGGNSKTSQIPSDFANLKNKIQKLFSLDDEILNYYDIIYKNEDGKIIKIINDDTFNIPKMTSCSIVFIISPKLNINNFIGNNNINSIQNENYFYNEYQNQTGGRGNWRGRRYWNRGNRIGRGNRGRRNQREEFWRNDEGRREYNFRPFNRPYHQNHYNGYNNFIENNNNLRINFINDRENYNQFHNNFNDRNISEGGELLNQNFIENHFHQYNNINLNHAPLIENLNNSNRNEIKANNGNNNISGEEERQYEEELKHEKLKMEKDFKNKYLIIIKQMEVLFDLRKKQEDIINTYN